MSPQENSTNPVRGKKKKVKPQKQGVKRNTKIDVCQFSMLFWLLKYQEWSWGGGVFGDFCFVLFFGSGGVGNHSGPCVWPPPQGGSCAVASLQHRGSVHTVWPPRSTSVLLRPDTTRVLLLKEQLLLTGYIVCLFLSDCLSPGPVLSLKHLFNSYQSPVPQGEAGPPVFTHLNVLGFQVNVCNFFFLTWISLVLILFSSKN